MDTATLKKKYNLQEVETEKKSLEKEMENAHKTGVDMSKLSADLAYYTQLYNHISNLIKYLQRYEEAEEILSNSSDNDLNDLAKVEIEELEKDIQNLDEEIKKIQIEREFTDEDDNRNVIVEIRAGAGGEEASLFARDIFEMYKSYATKQGWTVEIIDSNTSEVGGYKEIIGKIEGKNVYKKLKYESGVHRVQRVPVTESSGRIHTSTASVAIMPEARDIDIEIKPEDLRIDVMRASGAGGQCVNKTDSAVRITHIPTDIVVSCQETKYQAQNREKAMANLRSRLYERKRSEAEEKRSDMRSSQIGSAMRAEKIRTYNFPQNRITDHRIKKSWHNIEAVLYGELEEIINDVKEGIQMEMIKNGN